MHYSCLGLEPRLFRVNSASRTLRHLRRIRCTSTHRWRKKRYPTWDDDLIMYVDRVLSENGKERVCSNYFGLKMSAGMAQVLFDVY
ncbi:hypothetical protein CEXT_803401 [Caerostris extrusa]|uniref:Uncharacterized protein n=1 Tax=Caerostris extrusa TaxID=172846 RepID=A0AAV4T742_CAEEX|nr:hypothetical protein CEXT_803401 [Caerostris extrusa]